MKTGLEFLSTLTLIFIVLKLTNLISWSWWLVLLPLYFWLVPILFIMLIIFIIANIRE